MSQNPPKKIPALQGFSYWDKALNQRRIAVTLGVAMSAYCTDEGFSDGIAPTSPSGEEDPGLLITEAGMTDAIAETSISAIGRHRHTERDRDPPLI